MMFKQRKFLTLPTHKFAALILFGSIWFFLASSGGVFFTVLGSAYLVALLIVFSCDSVWVREGKNCEISRVCENILSIGKDNSIEILVNNKSGRALSLEIKDEPPEGFFYATRTLSIKAEPLTETKGVYKVNPPRRGKYCFGKINVRCRTVIGFAMLQFAVDSHKEVKVYPDISQTKNMLEFAKLNRLDEIGIRKSRMLGQGREFEGLREYVPDDSLRNIEWKATARRGYPVVKEYDVEQSQNVMILIDLGRIMSSRIIDSDGREGLTKADLAINASVLLAQTAANAYDRIGLFCFAHNPIIYTPPQKGIKQTPLLMNQLYALEPSEEESRYYENFVYLCKKLRKRSVVFLFTDIVDADASHSLIKSVSILSNRHLVVFVALSDYELEQIINSIPQNYTEVYSKAVAVQIIDNRKSAIAQITSLGAIAIDATPSDLSISVVNKYLQIKRKGIL